MPVPEAVTEKLVLLLGQIVDDDGPTETDGRVLTVRIVADEVTAGLQVPDTTQRYW